ncbi:MAG: membrane dipeptidase [Planctomycetaceae bacterium]|jgi:membrane dipeptidase|nr:membrane dipeptidase [Planctomycetaceae bacterium]
MWIFDAHLDLALNGVDWNRDLRQSVDDIRAQETALQMTDKGRRHNTLSFPELRIAQVPVCLTTLLARQEQPIDHSFGWTSPQTCYAMAHAHLAYYRAMERAGYLKMLKTKSDLRSHWDRYTQSEQALEAVGVTSASKSKIEDRVPLGFILTMEGADPVLTPDTIYEFHEAGLRALGLTHYGTNRYGGGTRSEVGLSLDAIELLKHCEQLGITIDVTHLSDVAFWQVIERFGGKIHASHQNARAICDWQRQFSDDQIKAVIDRGGVLGVALDIIMMQNGYVRGLSKNEATLEVAVDQICHVRDLANGSVAHVGIGTDLDGGYGYEQTPADLNKYRDVQKLVSMLLARGFSEQQVQSVFYGNWLRFFDEALP